MVGAARTADRVLDVAFNHRQRGDIQKLKAADRRGPARAPVLRQGVVAAAHRDPHPGQLVHARRAGGRRAAGGHRRARARLRRSSCSATPKVVAVSASTYDLLATNGFGAGLRGLQGQDRAATARRRRSTSRTSPRSSCALHDGGTLLVEASWAAHRRDGDEFGITLYGTDGGAELIVDDYAPKGSLQVFTDDGGEAVATRVPVKPGRGAQGGRRAVRGEGPLRRLAPTRRGGRRRARPRRRRLLPVGGRAARGPAGLSNGPLRQARRPDRARAGAVQRRDRARRAGRGPADRDRRVLRARARRGAGDRPGRVAAARARARRARARPLARRRCARRSASAR